AGGGQCAFARILLGNRVRKCGIYSILCTTREAELRFRFRYLQLWGLYSKSPKLAFNQWAAGSSPARLINEFNKLVRKPLLRRRDDLVNEFVSSRRERRRQQPFSLIIRGRIESNEMFN